MIKDLLEFGIINIDKPSGPTSFNISDHVRKKLNLRKTSHFGTLDPKVTGVLPIALNRACKLTGHFMSHDKTYIGIMRVHENKSMEEIKKIIKKKFTGKIQQLPPVKSRVKRQLREREVKKFKLLEQDGQNILFEAKVQAGTYIRKLIHDLGEEIGGAHMLELRRTQAGIFKEEGKKYPIVSLYEFEEAVDSYNKGDNKSLKKIIIPADIISEIYPSVEIKKTSVDRILTGKPIGKKDLAKKYDIKEGGVVCAFSGDKFIGIYKTVKDKYMFAKPEFVMQPILS